MGQRQALRVAPTTRLQCLWHGRGSSPPQRPTHPLPLALLPLCTRVPAIAGLPQARTLPAAALQQLAGGSGAARRGRPSAASRVPVLNTQQGTASPVAASTHSWLPPRAGLGPSSPFCSTAPAAVGQGRRHTQLGAAGGPALRSTAAAGHGSTQAARRDAQAAARHHSAPPARTASGPMAHTPARPSPSTSGTSHGLAARPLALTRSRRAVSWIWSLQYRQAAARAAPTITSAAPGTRASLVPRPPTTSRPAPAAA